jgi:PilZ domain-containing protein
MPEPAKTTNVTEHPADRRRVPRIPFQATSIVAETGSMREVVAQTTELSRFGCFVRTGSLLPQGSRIEVDLVEGGETFAASGKVAYVTGDGMGIVFSTVEPENYEILSKWLARTPRQSNRCSFAATVQVKELGSWGQGLVARDLSAGGCFSKTAVPLAKGSRIRVRIEHSGAEFTAVGRVTDNISADRMGVEFVEMEPSDRAILERWLADERADRHSP